MKIVSRLASLPVTRLKN